MRFLKRVNDDGDRFYLWPIRVRWAPGRATRWFDWHGWQVGTESVSRVKTSRACMPGYRRVFGQTLHLGPLLVMFGPRPRPLVADDPGGAKGGEEG
jgi:hypothetical protein